ncbi:hypothetical protein B0H12DRAFT_1097289, partial [Mycena haematopus]
SSADLPSSTFMRAHAQISTPLRIDVGQRSGDGTRRWLNVRRRWDGATAVGRRNGYGDGTVDFAAARL